MKAHFYVSWIFTFDLAVLVRWHFFHRQWLTEYGSLKQTHRCPQANEHSAAVLVKVSLCNYIKCHFWMWMQPYIKKIIKSLLLSHHHSTCTLVSEILESVPQTVQKQFTYRQYMLTDLSRRQCAEYTYIILSTHSVHFKTYLQLSIQHLTRKTYEKLQSFLGARNTAPSCFPKHR